MKAKKYGELIIGLFLLMIGIPLIAFISQEKEEVTLIATNEVYTCAMHPEIELTRPGPCPKCGMELVLKKKSVSRDYLALTDQQIQQAGVRYGEVKKRQLVKYIDATARVTYDETLMKTVTSWSGGRIEKLHVAFTGAFVKEGDMLAELYSPKLLYTIDELANALKALDKTNDKSHGAEIRKHDVDVIEDIKKKLRRFGLNDDQITEIKKRIESGNPPYTEDNIPSVLVDSPMTGYVVHKVKKEGEYVSEGGAILHIADLNRVWVDVDIYEYDLDFIRVGQAVTLTSKTFPDKQLSGEVTYIDPFVREKTRTIRVRCEFDNLELLLKPGMYMGARLEIKFPDLLSLPSDSVLLSGTREIVIRSVGNGRFQPVEVSFMKKWLYPSDKGQDSLDAGYFELSERYHQLKEGLKEGDRVVVSGAFLLNSEANFQRTLTKMLPAEEKK